MLSELSDKWRDRGKKNVALIHYRYADELGTELTATHKRMKQIFEDFRLDSGHSISWWWVDKYEQLQLDILEQVKPPKELE